MIEHKNINFEDHRGTIRDIFVRTPKDHCTVITSKPGVVRANHFHKKTTQYTYVVSGEFEMVVQKVDEDGKPAGPVEKARLKPGDLATHPPYEAHALKSINDSIMLAFADGVRGGDDYEKDVYRLEKPLI